MGHMAWFLRAIELDEGGWACRWSRTEFDRHGSLKEALHHLRSLAQDLGEVEIFVHPIRGQPQRQAAAQPE